MVNYSCSVDIGGERGKIAKLGMGDIAMLGALYH